MSVIIMEGGFELNIMVRGFRGVIEKGSEWAGGDVYWLVLNF